MRKILSFIVLLVISGTISFGQTNIIPLAVSQGQDDNQNLDQYLKKNVTSNSKVTIWSSNFNNPSQWVAAKIGQDANILNTWEWIADTTAFSSTFKAYVHPDLYMKSNTPMQGMAYFDGITNLIAQTYGISNSTLTNAVAINTSGYNSVSIKFYQLYKPFNADSALLEISSDNVNWNTINIRGSASTNSYVYGFKQINISQYAANKPQLWIRFRWYAPASTSSGSQYGGGYGWAVDDVELFEPLPNQLQVDRVTLQNLYTQIPSGLGIPVYYDAEITNIGGLPQKHTKLHGVDLTTGADSVSIDTNLAPGYSIVRKTSSPTWMWNTNYFFTPGKTLGTYKVTSYISTDSIPRISRDTVAIKIVCDTCMYSRDNNSYSGSQWRSVTSGSVVPFNPTVKYEVDTNRLAYGVQFVVSKDTKIGSKVKGLIYLYSVTGDRTIVAQSTNYYLSATDIPTATGANPPAISLPFSTPYLMQPDSLYLVGLQIDGGSDTVKIATDNTCAQYGQTSLYYDPTNNAWYVWYGGAVNMSAVMIRTIFNQYYHWSNQVGINEIERSANLFSCMPNPANTSTRIAYELKKNENVSIIITDITGRVVKNINRGIQSKGNYGFDLDLTGFTSGTYFYTLKTPSAQLTDKLIVVKR
ncbi:MAG: T9SS type A sorting domain-containing protein [Bacteroidetes bacterium]|nr:T9SS type A sorting domain-containing protein [Bacteroidota bacterium]